MRNFGVLWLFLFFIGCSRFSSSDSEVLSPTGYDSKTNSTDAALLVVDVNGARGIDASDGVDGSGHDFFSGRGAHGTNAGRSSAGQDAGKIFGNLSLDKTYKGTINIDLNVFSPEQGKAQNTQRVTVADRGFIYFTAHGGDGGHGGRGGDGAQGKRGEDGRDATAHSPGTDGADGGDGGNAGRGSDGSKAGDGGDIKLSISEDETDLIILVKQDVSQGVEGNAGRHGEPGSGGAGGSGGSPFTITYTTTHTDTYTNQDGSEGTRERYEYDYETVSGGQDGLRGSSGSSASGSLYPGEKGKTGSFEIIVTDENGRAVAKYTDAYDLRLTDFKFTSDSKNGIFEPGEKVTLSDIKISNHGKMPSPKANVFISLRNSEWILSKGIEIELPEIAAGKTISLKDHLKFDVLDFPDNKAVAMGKRFVEHDHINPIAEFKRVNRRPAGFLNAQTLTVTYPIEIEAISTQTTLAPGDMAEIKWRITNISDRDFPLAEGFKRDISVGISRQLKQGNNELNPEHFQFFDPEGKPFKLDGRDSILKVVAGLKSKESVIVSGIVASHPHAIPYKKATVLSHLKTNPLKNPERGIRDIQLIPTEFNVAQVYRHDVGADVLLIANHGTQHDEIQAWRTFLSWIGLESEVWDISLNGSVSITERMQRERSLAEVFRGRTIVWLDNEFKMPNQNTGGKSSDFVRLPQLRKILSDYGIGNYMPGPSSKNLQNFLIPTESQLSKQYKSVPEFMSAMSRGEVIYHSTDFKSFNFDASDISRNMYEVFQKININSIVFWGKPNKKYLEKLSVSVANYLSNLQPDQRYVVLYNFEPQAVRKRFGLFTEWNYGHVEVRKMVSLDNGNLVSVEVPTLEMHSPDFVFSSKNYMGFLSSLSFDQKIALLEKLVKEAEFGEAIDKLKWSQEKTLAQTIRLTEALADSILLDISTEQMVARRSTETFLMDGAIKARLPKLQKLSKLHLVKLVDAATPAGKTLVRITAGLRFMGETQVAWWDHLLRFLPGEFSAAVRRVSSVMIEEFSTYHFGQKNGLFTKAPQFNDENRRKLEAAIRERTGELRERSQRIQKETQEGRKAAGLSALYEDETRRSIAHSNTERDNVYITQEQNAKHVSAEEHRARMREHLEQEIEKAKQESNIPQACRLRIQKNMLETIETAAAAAH